MCQNCIKWVDCHNGKGFCLVRDLFTHTEPDDTCKAYEEGSPMPVEEFEEIRLN